MTIQDTPIRTRTAAEADLPEVHRMLIALAAHHGEVATITPAAFRAMTLGNPAACLIVAQLSGSPAPHPVGYALILERPNPATGRAGHDIAHLFVQAPFRGQGIGRALVAAARARVQAFGSARLTIGTGAGNATAHAAYRAMGLEELPAAGPRFAVALA